MTKSVRLSNSRLSVILQTSKVHIWLFDVAKKTVSFVNQDGKKTNMPLSPVLLDNYLVPEDYERLCTLLDAIASQKEEHATLEVHTTRGADGALSIFSIDLSVMRRNRNGKPSVIIGATTDVTANRRRQQQEKDTMLRYQHIFNSAMVDTVSYNEHGIIDDMNQKAVKALPGGLQRLIDAKITIQDVMGDPDITVDNMEYTYLTQIYKSPDDPRALNKILKRDELYYELQLIPVRDDDGHLLAIYGTGRDVTEIAKTYSLLQKNIIQLQEATDEQSRYIRNIDYVMKNGGVRMVNYSPDSHTLVIYSEIDHVQYQLTQTRLLSLTADESKRSTQRLLNTMDNRTRQPVKISIKSTLRVKNSTPLCLYFSFVPIIDTNGHVTEYFGMCRDISDIKATEQLLERETQKAQEVETLKNAFLRNMSYEIRIPLTSVVGFAELFEMEHTDEDERYFIQEINTNSEKLLKLINNILFLSRLDAHMIEFKKQPVDLASIFENRCQAAWADYQQPGVNYIVDNPYERLVVDIDFQNLGIVIEQIVINAAQHTTSGIVRARFDYNGEDLTVTVNDTGCGIPADKLDTIFGRFVTNNSGGSSGLGLAICQEIIGQMGGRIHLNSEVGKGTTVWVNIPCSCREIQRKLHQPV